MKKSLNEIMETMLKYRGKPYKEPLTKIEGLICLMAYFDISNKGVYNE